MWEDINCFSHVRPDVLLLLEKPYTVLTAVVLKMRIMFCLVLRQKLGLKKSIVLNRSYGKAFLKQTVFVFLKLRVLFYFSTHCAIEREKTRKCLTGEKHKHYTNE